MGHWPCHRTLPPAVAPTPSRKQYTGNDIARPIQLSGSIEVKVMIDMISEIGLIFSVKPNWSAKCVRTCTSWEEIHSFAVMTDSLTDDSAMFRACGILVHFPKNIGAIEHDLCPQYDDPLASWWLGQLNEMLQDPGHNHLVVLDSFIHTTCDYTHDVDQRRKDILDENSLRYDE